MTATEAAQAYRSIAVALGTCTFLPGSWDKRFAKDMAFAAARDAATDFTEAQRAHLLRLVHKFRRQIDARVIEVALDLAVYAADRRVAEGKGALADFSKQRSNARSDTSETLRTKGVANEN